MLLTNFSTGELSETLFGRVDMPQYYQGAARVENFDVIPTGGIRRRNGTERLAVLEGEGRIIPFIISRRRSFLLYLTPLKITSFVLESGRVAGSPQVFTSSSSLPLYGSLGEIQDVQYAQNFDTMILCHENYQPLLITLNNSALTISKFQIDIDVEQVSHEGKIISGFGENDSKYQAEGYLRKQGEWPRAATFFGGRLVFAGTLASPQRVFASKSDNIHKFATYKKFITETREYVAVNCKVKAGSNSVELLDPAEFGRFKKSPADYYVELPSAIAGARVTGVNLKSLLLDRSAGQFGIDDAQMNNFNSWKNQIERDDSWSRAYKFFWFGEKEFYLRYRNGQFNYYELTTPKDGSPYTGNSKIYKFEVYDAENSVKNRQYLANYVYGNIGGTGNESTDLWFGNASYPLPMRQAGEIEFHRFIDDFWAYIQTSMQYRFIIEGAEKILYGTPAQILQQASGSVEIETIVVLYASDFLFDRYPTADCGYTFELASDLSDAIRWLVVNKGLIVGTESGEWIVPPGVTAVNVQASRNSSYGSDSIQGTAIGDAACFFQAGKKSIVEYYIPQQDNNFRANNMAALSPQMLHESEARDFDFASSPHTRLFIVREDGSVVTLLYDRAFGVFAWTRFAGSGKVKSLAVIPAQSGNDELYLLVERSGRYLLERFDYGGKVFLDSYMQASRNTWNAARAAYPAGAAACRIFQGENGEVLYETLDADAEPDWNKGGDVYLGFPYRSVVRTMPILANDKMKNQRITSLAFRFLESCLPLLSSIAGGKNIATDTITNLKAPFSGIHKVPFPGTWNEDVQVELACETPEPVVVLSLNAEVQ